VTGAWEIEAGHVLDEVKVISWRIGNCIGYRIGYRQFLPVYRLPGQCPV